MSVKKKRIIYIVSLLHKSLLWEWKINYYKNSEDFEVSFVLMNAVNNTPAADYILKSGLKLWQINYSGKKDLVKAIIKIVIIFLRERPAIINVNGFDASLAGMIAARLAGIKIRINTRHHSNYHLINFPHAVKYDKLVNKLSTHIIAASEVVKKLLVVQEGVPEEKVKTINFGFELSEFENITPSRINSLKEKYKLPENSYPVVGVISRFIFWKGIQYIIPAFQKFLNKFPQAHLILANASGEYNNNIRGMLKELPENSYTTINYEEDSAALYQLFDYFIHVPVDNESEAFGQVYVESLAAGIPSIFTLSGIANDFIVNGENALVVNYKSTEEIYNALFLLSSDKALRDKIIIKGKLSVQEKFQFKRMAVEMDNFYYSEILKLSKKIDSPVGIN